MDLLSNPGVKPLVMTFSVGLEGQPQFPTCVNTLNLVVIPIKWFVIAMAGLLVVVYIFFRLAMRTALLRDAGPSQGISNLKAFWQPRKPDNDLGPFSLARTQMAFWFFMVLASFLVIWLITGDTDTITTGVLVLIGISAGTALGSTAIDSSRRSDATQPPPTQKSEGFLNDILSEGKKGVSFHRFQIAIWTIVLGFVFLRSVLNDLAMPDFDANLLTLMGISSGTYLGLKLPEQPASQPPAGEQEPKEDNKPRTREKRMT